MEVPQIKELGEIWKFPGYKNWGEYGSSPDI